MIGLGWLIGDCRVEECIVMEFHYVKETLRYVFYEFGYGKKFKSPPPWRLVAGFSVGDDVDPLVLVSAAWDMSISIYLAGGLRAVALSNSASLSNPTTVLSKLIVFSLDNELARFLFPLVGGYDFLEFWLEAGVMSQLEARWRLVYHRAYTHREQRPWPFRGRVTAENTRDMFEDGRNARTSGGAWPTIQAGTTYTLNI
ncbi:hypothetical protein EVAR_40129_1 [Eumeta japonica]|uniref:Uncharacterized protein n=1 Tax=Eumeta variegata TaxID=151549 RepID=A0A4C1W962_EUMVA|nr:hypothetical protein EVAR_40129_1 [Eumeta japonica]